MLRKHIIIISTMLIIGIGFFVTTFLSSRRTSNLYTDEETESKVSNAISKTYTPQSRFSSPREAKDVAIKEAEETTVNDSKGPPDTSANPSCVVDSTQNEELPDSLTSQAESQNDEVSKAKEGAAKYAALEEPLQQIRNLNSQYYSIVDELAEKMDYIGKTGSGIDMGEFTRKLDERDTIARQILAIAREASKIVPDAIKVRELSRDKLPYIGTIVNYDIIISREKLKAALGKIPPGIEDLFPAKENRPIGFGIPEDENFSHYELYRRKAQNR